MEYMNNENYKYLVIEASHGDYYGFNLKITIEQKYAMKIVSPNKSDDFLVVGWKVVKKLPSWVCNANSWIDFMNGKYDEDDNKKETEDEEEDKEQELDVQKDGEEEEG